MFAVFLVAASAATIRIIESNRILVTIEKEDPNDGKLLDDGK